MASYRTTRRVEFVDTDMAGIAHFSRFFLWMEEVEQEFLRSLGYAVSMQKSGEPRFGFPRVSAQCEFFRPARFEDEIECAITVEHVGGKSVRYGHEFRVRGELAARGTLTTCYCIQGPEGLKGVELPADIRQKLAGQ
jgi:acyl-CoA thioester hydrolase